MQLANLSNSSSKKSDEEKFLHFYAITRLCNKLPRNHRVNFPVIGNTVNPFDSKEKRSFASTFFVLVSYVAIKSSSQTFERESTWSDG